MEWFANFLDGGISATDKVAAPFDFTFCSNENVYNVALKAYQDTLPDGSVLTEYDMSVSVSLKPGNVLYRFYNNDRSFIIFVDYGTFCFIIFY